MSSPNLPQQAVPPKPSNEVSNSSVHKVKDHLSRKGGKDAIKFNNKFSGKLAYKAKEATNIRIQIRAFFKDQIGVILPKEYKAFKEMKDTLLEHCPELEELAKATYQIFPSVSLYAKFPDNSLQHISTKYSRHRLDPVWLFRKSQLVRKVWREYLTETQEHRNYRPCHLVLTLPHKGGLWKGKSFYARELIKLFTELRRRSAFKNSIKGGEYGLEISNGKNGLHIHIHSLCFVEYGTNLNELRKLLKKAWKKVCGIPASQHVFLHLETLYRYSKDEKETFDKVIGVQEIEYEDGGFGYAPLVETKERRKKIYITKDSSDDEYLMGVMECIKYHFKPSDLYVKNEDGEPLKNRAGYPIVDIELVNEIVSNTKGLRMYGTFGFCYGEKQLNYRKRVEAKETDLEVLENEESTTLEENEEIKLGDSDKGKSSLINPATGEPANEDEYTLILAQPEHIRHNSKQALFDAGKPIYDQSSMFDVDGSLGVKEVMSHLIRSKDLYGIITYDAYQQYEKNGRKFNTGRCEFDLSECYRY